MKIAKNCEGFASTPRTRNPLQRLAPQAGLEPATQWLTVTANPLRLQGLSKALRMVCEK